jgi:hypothetical protein
MKGQLQRTTWGRKAALLLAAAGVMASVGAAGAARADDSTPCSSSTEAPYRMQLSALTGPAGADLTLTVDTAAGCAAPEALKKVQLKIYGADGSVDRVRNLTDVPAAGGVANGIGLGAVPRGRRIEADVLVQAGTPARTYVVRGATNTLLRPDLVVESISAPQQVLLGRPFAVSVVIAERNKDVGATATIALPGATRAVEVAAGGTATVEFPLVTLGAAGRVDLAAEIRNASPAETDGTNNALTTPIEVLRPPDLVIQSITPEQTLVGKPFTVSVVIAERNNDLGANATVTISAIPGASRAFEVAAGGTTTVDFSGVTFDSAVPVTVTAEVLDAAPAEDDTTNNALTATVDVTKNELPVEPIVLFPSLLGYGAQFNGHLYAPITQPFMQPGSYADVETKVNELQPQLVRIFYNDNWEENADGTHTTDWRDNYASFVKVVELAQETGATIDISYQNLGNIVRTDKLKRTPEDEMAKYADTLEDLVKNHGLTNVRWADVGNEPNSGAVTLDQIYALYRALNRELVARGLSDQIRLMSPGLVENAKSPGRTHYDWLRAIAANLGDIIDGYAEHVYWTYDDPGRLEYRLRDTYNLMQTVLPEGQRKPTYMMEFGIRGYISCGTKPALRDRYYRDADCTDIWRTNIAAFQQLWFAIDSAQLGVAGAAKWDAYWAIYDRTSINAQVYWMTGPPSEGYALQPTYYAMWLLFHTTAPGWKIMRVDPWNDDDSSVPAYGVEGHTSNDQPEQELVSYAGPNGELTVVGLDTHGRSLNGVSPDAPSAYSIGGLTANTTFNLALWNATGDGTNSVAGTVTTNAAGVARFDVPVQAAFALTTVPVS